MGISPSAQKLSYAGRQGVTGPARHSTGLRALRAFTAHMIAPGYAGEATMARPLRYADLRRNPGSLAKRPDGT